MSDQASVTTLPPRIPNVRQATRPRTASPERLAAVALMGVVIGIITAILWMHRSGSGSDAYAYWYGVHVWLDGGDPYRLQVAALPWHYPPWMLPIFLPWALLPWSFAWPVWRVITIVPLMLTAHWAFERRPMATARAATMLAVPIGIALDTGNVILLCALALWIAQFSRPRRAALLWTVVTAIKWFPVVFWFVLSPSARRWALVLGAVALVLALVTWHWTVEQVVSISLTGVPHSDSILALRLDHLAIAWAAIPWLWRRGLSWAQERWGSAGEPVRQKLRRAGPAQIG